MNAQQLFVVAVAVAAVGVCGRQLNFFDNPGFDSSVFNKFIQDAAPAVYGSESAGGVGVGVVEDFAKGAFANLNSFNGSATGSFSAFSDISGGSNDTISYVDLSAGNTISTGGPGDAFFTSIGSGATDFIGGGSSAGFDFSVFDSASTDSPAGVTTGSLVDAFSIAKEGFASSGSSICVGPTCF